MKTVVIIQARMSSSRLPGKILMPYCGQSQVWHIVQRCRAAKGVNQVLVATSTEPSDDPAYVSFKRQGIDVFRGDLDNVLKRYYDAAIETKADVIVRATGDNPLTDPYAIEQLLEEFQSGVWDYLRGSDCPDGTCPEVFSMDALKTCYNEAKTAHQREHVTPYFYEHPERFAQKALRFEHYAPFKHLRLTVDTPEDREVLSQVYMDLYQSGGLIALQDVFELYKRKPQIFDNIQGDPQYVQATGN